MCKGRLSSTLTWAPGIELGWPGSHSKHLYLPNDLGGLLILCFDLMVKLELWAQAAELLLLYQN